MEQAGNLLSAVPNGVREIEGVCEKHGPKKAYIYPRGPQEWTCSACAMEKQSALTDQMARDARQEAIRRAACLPERFLGQTFTPGNESQAFALRTAKAFRQAITAGRAWAVLALSGPTGTGKTLLATRVCEKLMREAQMTVRYCTAQQMVSEIQAAYGADGKTEEAEVLKFSLYDLLVLDELDAIRGKDNTLLLITEVINRRYNMNRPMVIITNQDIGELPRFIGDRAASRLSENALVAMLDGPDQRKMAP